jgi:hypothetical protein
MARHWREKRDETRHTDWMSTTHIGGVPAEKPTVSLIETWSYFVEVCGFRFEFVALDQLRECLAFFTVKHHGPNRLPEVSVEHYWQRWYERLPSGMLASTKREKIAKALRSALADFVAGT